MIDTIPNHYKSQEKKKNIPLPSDESIEVKPEYTVPVETNPEYVGQGIYICLSDTI